MGAMHRIQRHSPLRSILTSREMLPSQTMLDESLEVGIERSQGRSPGERPQQGPRRELARRSARDSDTSPGLQAMDLS